ncbi:uncharacterized protein BP5553_00297 [Venustampulla echinocandica]|uniref:Uncharacterized protein n=1 Tax=Venustampulla echinocandica TaxID=2656787 RepID=A0A370TXT8_9HELO|nr:uncharacterized protein BP5553_00297 [Venustampulla echinocandica]RDL40318.1 hypothetical protein BP5553_00297 [Venustampulla echinocandica]
MDQSKDADQDIGNSYMYHPYGGVDPYGAYPRQPVTPSMLYAYARMRGPPDTRQVDPLMYTLYPTAVRAFDQQGCLPPPLQFCYPAEDDLEEFPKGTKFYWEPIITTLRPFEMQPETMAEAPKPQAKCLTYDEFIKENPPTIGKNHYKGDDVYANFGYVCINGKWVDPDSEGELYKAYMGSSDGPYAAAGLRDLRNSQAPGPRIMSAEEQEAFYKEMADDDDGQGDHRDSRIDPATFARWAEGAAQADKYEERDMPAQMEIPEDLYSDNTERAIPPMIQATLQFDEEMGGRLSGVYDLEESPKMVKNPHGYLDMIARPLTFTWMNPQAALRLDKEAFGIHGEDHEDLNPPVLGASLVERLTSEAAALSLASLADPATAKAEYLKTKDYVFGLRSKFEEGMITNKQISSAVGKAAMERLLLTQHATMMRAQVDANMKEKEAAHLDLQRKHKGFAQRVLDRTRQSKAEPLADQTRGPDYKRYISEAVLREQVAIARVDKSNKRLTSDLEALTKEVEALKLEHHQLVAALQQDYSEESDGYAYLHDGTFGKSL